MRSTTLILCVIMLVGCTERSGGTLDDTRDLAAVLDGGQQTLFVREGMAEGVLAKLNAREVEGEKMFEATVDSRTVRFQVVTSTAPQIHFPSTFGYLQAFDNLFVRMYINAECGQGHPGFFAPCIQTFGPHRAFGNSMTWQVNNWKSCTTGRDTCIEVWKPVGAITYYPDFTCSDTMFVTRPIMEFRCD